MRTYMRSPFEIMARRWMNESDFSQDDEKIFFPVDVIEENDRFVFSAMLPGLSAGEVSIKIENEKLTIEGELPGRMEESSNYILNEQPSGKFHRSFNLNVSVDPAKAEADMENGILTLSIPKAEAAKPRSIKVNAK